MGYTTPYYHPTIMNNKHMFYKEKIKTEPFSLTQHSYYYHYHN